MALRCRRTARCQLTTVSDFTTISASGHLAQNRHGPKPEQPILRAHFGRGFLRLTTPNC